MDESNGEDESTLNFSSLPPRVILNDIFEFFVFLLDWKRLEKDELCLFGIFRKDRLRHIHFLFPCLFLKSVSQGFRPKHHVHASVSKIRFLRLSYVGPPVVSHLSSNSSKFVRLRELIVLSGDCPGMGGDAYPKDYSSLFSDKDCFNNLENLALMFCEGRYGKDWNPDFRKKLKKLSITLNRGGTIPSEFLNFEFGNLRKVYIQRFRAGYGMFHTREEEAVLKIPRIETISIRYIDSEIDKIGFEIGSEKTKSLRLSLKNTTLSFKKKLINFVEEGCPNLEILHVDEKSLKKFTVKNILRNSVVVESYKKDKWSFYPVEIFKSDEN